MKTIIGDQIDPGRGGLFDKKYRFTVKYVVPLDLIPEFVDAVKPFSALIVDHGYKYFRVANQTKSQDSRIGFIRKCLVGLDWVRIGSFFRRINRMGYGYSFKLLQRDVIVMGALGMIETKKVRGGKYGNTTIIKLKEDDCPPQLVASEVKK